MQVAFNYSIFPRFDWLGR